jgi:hypothetical protein
VTAASGLTTVSSPNLNVTRSRVAPRGSVTVASACSRTAVALPAVTQREPLRRSTRTAVKSGTPVRRSGRMNG